MPTRRTHVKSRGGCNQCKQRKIKCNEAKPVCDGCVKRELQCIYDHESAQRQRPTFSATHSDSGPSPGVATRAIDLEIIHFWTLHTHRTCDRGVMSTTWWQEALPTLAFSHDHLLSALLAFTSLHIAYSRPSGGHPYTAIAVHYRDRALQVLTPLLSDIPSDQAEACFWSSALIGLITLAMHNTSSTPTERQNPHALLLELATLWRGADSVDKARARVSTAPSPSYHSPHLTTPTPKLQDAELDAALLRARDCVLTDASLAPTAQSQYAAAIEELAMACSLLESEGSFSGLLSWLPCLEPEILADFESSQPTAALIGICYGAALHTLRHTWYIRDLGQRLVHELTPVVPLRDPDKVKLVNWARERVCSRSSHVTI